MVDLFDSHWVVGRGEACQVAVEDPKAVAEIGPSYGGTQLFISPHAEDGSLLNVDWSWDSRTVESAKRLKQPSPETDCVSAFNEVELRVWSVAAKAAGVVTNGWVTVLHVEGSLEQASPDFLYCGV